MKYLRKLGQIASVLALVVATTLTPGLVALNEAFALTNPASIAPRTAQTQQTAYLRFNVTATGTGINVNGLTCVAAVSGGGNCSVKAAAVPYNAFIVRAYQQIITSFNSTTTDTLGIGTASGTGNQNVVAAQSVHGSAGVGTSLTVASLGLGTATGVTGNGITQTGANGGFDLYITFVYTGASIATAGQAILVVEYIAPNDGTCTDVPQGSTAPAC